MTLSKSTHSLLNSFDIDPIRGFLPKEDPLAKLPPSHGAWDEAIQSLPQWIAEGKHHPEIEKIPHLEVKELDSKAEHERTMLILCFLGHAYLFSETEKPTHLPENIAVPWVAVSEILGRRPALSHASLDLQNFKAIDPSKPLTAENMELHARFGTDYDEDWFFLLTTEIEAVGGAVPGILLELHDGVGWQDEQKILQALEILVVKIQRMLTSLQRMGEHCRPEYFYHRIRPFIDSIVEVNYKGVKDPVRSYAGGSAAQSSLPQAIDAALGIRHDGRAGSYLKDMRNYMPPKHAAFIRHLEDGPKVKAFCKGNDRLLEAFQACIAAMQAFRNYHMRIVSEYIIKPSGLASAKGTGGTDAMEFLKKVRNDTKRSGMD